MLKQLVWMIAGGVAAAVVYGASRFAARWRSVNFIGPNQFAGLLDDEGERALAARLRALTSEDDSWPDAAVDQSLEEPDEHEEAGI